MCGRLVREKLDYERRFGATSERPKSYATAAELEGGGGSFAVGGSRPAGSGPLGSVRSAAPPAAAGNGRADGDRPARYNIPPTEQDEHIYQDAATGRRFVRRSRWGLTPQWDRDGKLASKTFNARAETLMEKASFRDLVPRNRCVVPITGFYEWDAGAGRGKRPMYIRAKDGRSLAVAGLWTVRRNPHTGETEYSHTMITTQANGTMAPFHHRMPVILDDAGVDLWLNPAVTDPAPVLGLLRPCPDDALVAYPVSTAVNKPANDSPQLILPVPD